MLPYILMVFCTIATSSALAQLYTIDGKHTYGLGSNITLGIHLSKVKHFLPYVEANINAGYLYQGKRIGVTPQVQYSFKWNTFSTLDKGLSHQFFGSIQLPISLSTEESKNSRHYNSNYNQPFYAFADLSTPAIKNPYHYAFSLGTQGILMKNPKENFKFQQVGTVSLKADEFHIFYQNDGVLLPFMIDGYDRWYTSSLLIAWHRSTHQTFNHFALAYNRFTGHSPLSYELAKKIGDNVVDYKQQGELRYNEDYLRFTAGHNQIGNISLKATNPELRVIQGQKAVHYVGNMPYHIDNSQLRFSVDVQSQIFISKHLNNEKH